MCANFGACFQKWKIVSLICPTISITILLPTLPHVYLLISLFLNQVFPTKNSLCMQPNHSARHSLFSNYIHHWFISTLLHSSEVNIHGIVLNLASFSWQIIELYLIIFKIATKRENYFLLMSIGIQKCQGSRSAPDGNWHPKVPKELGSGVEVVVNCKSNLFPITELPTCFVD